MTTTLVETVARPVSRAEAPKATRIAEDQAYPVLTPEMKQHKDQVVERSRDLDRLMMDFAAVGVSPGVRSLAMTEPIAELGTFTYFTLRRVRDVLPGGRAVICLAYTGYKSAFADGRIVLGGPDNNVCAYDLRFRPFPEAGRGGKILSSRKRTTLQLGLTLDLAIERVTTGLEEPRQFLQLPQFWAGFAPDAMPVTEDCPALRRLVLAAARPGYSGPTVPSMRSPGGTVTAICKDADGGIAIGFDGTEMDPSLVAVIPQCAVMAPYVRVGMTVEKGAPLGDFVPRMQYTNVDQIAAKVGVETVRQMFSEVASLEDIRHAGLVLRKAELCPTQLDGARLFEDARPMLVASKEIGSPQVVSVRDGLSRLRPAYGAPRADLASMRPNWDEKLKSLRGRKENRGSQETT